MKIRSHGLAVCSLLLAALVHAAAPLAPITTLRSRASAQVPNDLVVTGGLSWEDYSTRGNFSVVTVPTKDSTEHATAAVGEIGARARVSPLYQPDRQILELTLDGGLRQFAAMGFHLRDYAPREWVTRVTGSYWRAFPEVGNLTVHASYRGRSVEDRPPMPLFLQPGYGSVGASGTFQFVPIQNVAFELQLDLERTNYSAPRLLPFLDLLDRKSQGFEVGALTRGEGDWSVRFYSGFRSTHYEQQVSDPTPTFRRDRTVNVGALWNLSTLDADAALRQASIGVEGTVNRSNSLRPQYDALSVTGDVYVELPWWSLSTGLTSLLTWKAYVHQTQFARLVPGEEADNASVVHLDLIRPLASNLNGTLRFGWTRAETDIGNSYYNRVGTSLLFNFRPAGQ